MTRGSDGGLDAPFTSDLDVNGFAGLRGVGFEPVGQVAGTAVFRVNGAYLTCWRGPRRTPVADEPWEQFEREARRLALDRLREHCTAAGGHGVVGARLTIRPFVDDSVEYVLSGTAVRAASSRPARRAGPFTAEVGAAGVAKLLRAGWMPVSVVFGVAVRAVHDVTTDIEQASIDNLELTVATKLVQAARAAARSALAAQAARAGAHTVILSGGMGLSVDERPCDATDPGTGFEPVDRIVQADLTGTALVRLHRPIGPAVGRPLSVMPLERGSRPAVNWRNVP